VDCEGETVDYAGRGEPYSLKVAAAHWRIVYDDARVQPALATTAWIGVRAAGASFVVRGLPEGYAVVVVFARRAGLSAGLRRAFDHCASELAREAGWPTHGTQPTLKTTWIAIDVETRAHRPTRPAAIRRGPLVDAVEVIGLVSHGLGRGERGWRVRNGAGVEATLVREPGGYWYADEAALAIGCDPAGFAAANTAANQKVKKTL
jgi:hypothetical protein